MSGSLSKAPGFVADAFNLRAAVPFVPENIVLGQYTFLPWVRTGLAAALEPAQGAALRATVTVSVDVQDDAGGTQPVSKTLTLRGPGDVVGLDPSQIVRRVPAPGTVDAEESFLAHVEFDRPELPWLFTPFAPQNDRLQPWLVLIVADAARAQLMPGLPGRPQQLRVAKGELPSLDDAWAFAHAQVVGPADGAPSVEDRLTDEHGPQNLSRLVCPRKLPQNRSWIACLVPSFDCGVHAGLGTGGGTLAPAWQRAADGSDADDVVVLPVYDSWTFHTAAAGDFELLAKRITGVQAPWNIGRRIIDAANPRGRLAPLAPGAPGRLQVLRCALVSPTPMPPDQPPESSAWDAAARDALRVEVDRANVVDENLPRVGPRLYAKFQRAQNAIGPVFGAPAASTAAADADWFPELNTSPMHRIVAGLGTRVVQHDQEPLMQAAWAQVGDIEKANRVLSRIQFGRYVGEALHTRFGGLGLGPLAQVLRGVQGKLRVDGTPLTISGAVAASRVAPAALTAAFRRAVRPRGPLARFASGPAARQALTQLVASDVAFRDFRRAYVEPDGIATLSAAAISSFAPALVAKHLGVPEANAPAELARRVAGRKGSIVDVALSPVATWNVPRAPIDLGSIVAQRIGDQVEAALPDNVESDPARSEVLSSLLVGVANSTVADVAAHADARVSRIGDKLPFSALATAPGVPGNIGLPPVVRTPGVVLRGGTIAFGSGTIGRRVPGGTTIDPRIVIGGGRTGNVPPGTPPQPPAPPPARTRFETPTSRVITDVVNASRALDPKETALAFSALVLGGGVMQLPKTPERPALTLQKDTLLRAVAPAPNATRYAKGRLAAFPSWLAKDWFDNGRVDPIMAAPHFDRPMYEALDAYARDWLVPGLGSIQLTDFVTVLETNPRFNEAFFAGLSDEMGRELLWRGYPTDQRGTYFRRFWNPDHDELTTDIHRFSRTPLGTHLAGGQTAKLVLVVRAELVRRYPDAIFLAMRARAAGPGKPEFSDDPGSLATILFHAHLSPDIILVGFDLTKTQVQNEPWWFLVTEHPTAPRFGLDLFEPGNVRAPGAVLDRNALDWNDLTDAAGRLDRGLFLSPRGRTVNVNDPLSTPPLVAWPGTAAAVARTLLQSPLRAAFNGQKLIAPAL